MMNNNMMGMGRGAGGMMMPGQGIPHMGMQGMPNGMAPNIQAQQQQHQPQQPMMYNANDQYKAIQAEILRKLQQQPPRPGWWTGVSFQVRLTNILQIWSGLTMLGQDNSSASHVAQTFEFKTFSECQSQPQYDAMIKQKLTLIRNHRQERMMNAGGGAGAGQPMQNNLNMMMGNQQNPMQNQQFNPNILSQQNLGQPFQNNAMMQQPQAGQLPPGMMPNGMMQNNMPRAPNQPPNQTVNPAAANMQASQLTPAEQQLAGRLAQIMYNNLPQNEKDLAATKFPASEILVLQSRGIDPAMHMCRRMAINNVIRQRSQTAMGMQANGMPNQMGMNQQGPMPNNQGPAQNLINGMNGPNTMIQRQQNLTQGFNGNNLETIMGQQANAIRRQQEGQMVVPASQQRPGQPGVNMQPNGMNMTPQQQQQQQQQQAFIQQRAAMQAQLNPQGMQQVRMPQGGQGRGMPGPGMPMQQTANPNQQSPAMPNINRSVNQTPRPESVKPGNIPHQPTPNPQSQNSTPRMPQQPQQPIQNQNQQPQQPMQQMNQSSQQTMQMNGANKPMQTLTAAEKQAKIAQFQKQLNAMPPAQRAVALAQFRAKIAPQQTGPQPAVPNQSAGIVQNTPQPGNVNLNQGPKPLQLPTNNAGPRPGMPNMAMQIPPEHRALMDAIPFPRGTLAMDEMKNFAIPNEVRTWGDIRKWFNDNAHMVPATTATKFMSVQNSHYAANLKKKQEQEQQRRANQQPTSQQQQQQTAQLPPQQQQQQQIQQAQQPNQQQMQQQKLQQQLQAQQQQKLMQAANIANQRSQANQQKPPTTAPQAPMGQMRPGFPPNPAQLQALQAQQFVLSLPEVLTPEICNGLRSKHNQLAGKSDDEIRAIIAARKKQAMISLTQLRQQQSLQAAQNGQPIPQPNTQMQAKVPQHQPAPQQQMNQDPAAPNNQRLNATSVMTQNNKAQPPVVNAALSQQVPPAQTAQQSAPMQRVISAVGASQQGRTPPDEAKRRRYEKLVSEVQNQYRPGNVLPLDQQSKEKMLAILREIQPFLQRSRPGILYYFAFIAPNNEQTIKSFLHSRLALLDQYEDQQYFLPKEHFTIHPDMAEKWLANLKLMFRRITEFQNQNNRPQGQAEVRQPEPPKAATQPPIKVPEVKPMAQKSKAEKPPSAPTSETPPNSFHFGASPPTRAPDGVPKYNPTMNKLTQDKLILPENKLKRKLNNQVPNKTQSPPQAKSSTPSAAPIVPPKQDMSFKCIHPGCDFHKRGFNTAELLAQHIEDVHKEKEPEDGLLFALEMARFALGLDADGNAIRSTKMEKSVSAQTMKKSASTQGLAPKLDGGVSMSRGTTQTSNLGLPRTPQSMGKPADKSTPGSNETRKEALTPDSWADCPVTPAELGNLFPANDAIYGTIDFTGLTPATTLTNGKSERNTPNSDVAADVDVTAVVNGSENWIPRSFYNGILDPDYNACIMDDDILDMDFDMVFPPDPKRRKTDPDGGFNADLFTLSWSDES